MLFVQDSDSQVAALAALQEQLSECESDIQAKVRFMQRVLHGDTWSPTCARAQHVAFPACQPSPSWAFRSYNAAFHVWLTHAG